jgi:hypothetical protein
MRQLEGEINEWGGFLRVKEAPGFFLGEAGSVSSLFWRSYAFYKTIIQRKIKKKNHHQVRGWLGKLIVCTLSYIGTQPLQQRSMLWEQQKGADIYKLLQQGEMNETWVI